MRKSILGECLRIARKKLPTHPQLLNYAHFSFLILQNRICSVGMNRPHEPDRKFGYHGRILKDDFLPKLHSEMDMLADNWRNLKNGFETVNLRLNKAGEARLSMPCSVCRSILWRFGCEKVYFSHETGWGTICP